MFPRTLAFLKTQEQLAEAYEYSSWKYLDIYMRRKHFGWDSREQNYVPKINRVANRDIPLVNSSRTGQVISLLAKEGADLKTVAQRVGFKDHLDLAKYMTGRGYEWDSEQGNYAKK